MDADSHAPHPRGAAPPELVAILRDDYRSLMRMAMYAGAGKEEAQDAIQEASVGLAKNWHTIDKPLPYLRQAVMNNVKKILRSERNRMLRQSAYLARSFERPPGEPSIWDDTAVCEEMLSKLTPSQRDIVHCLLDGFTPAEAAELLGCSYDAVRSALTSMRHRLRAAGYAPRARAASGDDIGRRSSGHSAREEDR